jgi:DNA-directed RNA polymerase subunit K/omega
MPPKLIIEPLSPTSTDMNIEAEVLTGSPQPPPTEPQSGEDTDTDDDNPVSPVPGASESEPDASEDDGSASEDEDEDEEYAETGSSDDDDDGDAKQETKTPTKASEYTGPHASAKAPQPPAGLPGTLVIDTDDSDASSSESDDEDWRERLQRSGLTTDKGGPGTALLREHPESAVANVDQVRAAVHIIRTSNGQIMDPNHATTPLITRYEYAKVLGIRTEQLSAGGEPAIPVPYPDMSSAAIAEAEYRAGLIPFIIRRPLPSGKSEYWRVSDLQDVSY